MVDTIVFYILLMLLLISATISLIAILINIGEYLYFIFEFITDVRYPIIKKDKQNRIIFYAFSRKDWIKCYINDKKNVVKIVMRSPYNKNMGICYYDKKGNLIYSIENDKRISYFGKNKEEQIKQLKTH